MPQLNIGDLVTVDPANMGDSADVRHAHEQGLLLRVTAIYEDESDPEDTTICLEAVHTSYILDGYYPRRFRPYCPILYKRT